eukprot:m.38541 g.38541  ORF g.38541 m.38541 type:complete len:67 (+) comp10205_c0_seq4:8369-8569(+)
MVHQQRSTLEACAHMTQALAIVRAKYSAVSTRRETSCTCTHGIDSLGKVVCCAERADEKRQTGDEY